MKCKNTIMSDLQTDLEASLLETLFVGRTMCGQITIPEDFMKTLKTQLANAYMELENLTNESSIMKANI